jgi:hypothetical protein
MLHGLRGHRSGHDREDAADDCSPSGRPVQCGSGVEGGAALLGLNASAGPAMRAPAGQMRRPPRARWRRDRTRRCALPEPGRASRQPDSDTPRGVPRPVGRPGCRRRLSRLFRTRDHTLLPQGRPVPRSRLGLNPRPVDRVPRTRAAGSRPERFRPVLRNRPERARGTARGSVPLFRRRSGTLAYAVRGTPAWRHRCCRRRGLGGGSLLIRGASCMVVTLDSSPFPAANSPRRRCQRSNSEWTRAGNGRRLPRGRVSAARTPLGARPT